jgi:hypothetical protein
VHGADPQLTGKVKPPKEAAALYAALADAESGRAQAQTQGGKLDTIVGPDMQIELRDGEVLNLPPTPDQMDGSESAGAYASGETQRRAPPAPPAIPARRVPPPPPSSRTAGADQVQRPEVVHHESGRSEYSQPSPPLGAGAAAGFGHGHGSAPASGQEQAQAYPPPADDVPGYDAPPYDPGHAPTASAGGLPGYEAGGAALGPGEYPPEKVDSQTRVVAAAGALDGGVAAGEGLAYDYAAPSGSASVSAVSLGHAGDVAGLSGQGAPDAYEHGGAGYAGVSETQAYGQAGDAEVEAARLAVERTRM